MKKRIPTYPLNMLARSTAEPLDVYVLGRRDEGPETIFGAPYRTTYYGVGLCKSGRAQLTADLDDYEITRHSVIAMSPQTIKQWRSMSRDFHGLTVLFTRAFFVHQNALDPDRLPFFEQGGKHVFPLSGRQAQLTLRSLERVEECYSKSHPYRDELLKALINVVLYELTGIYQTENPTPSAPPHRGKHLTTQFKALVTRHCVSERSVSFYAHEMAVTPRHLSATVRDNTGKTASEWIQEAVLLEARVLLQDPALSIAQVAEELHFPDPSTFGKFIKKHTGQSPLSYRKQRMRPSPTF